MLAYALLLSLTAQALAQSSVYVPGNVDDTPGAALSEVGVGADGLTTYVIEGVTLAENSAEALLTQATTDGATTGNVIYSCTIGADAVASCAVSQDYDAVTYFYTEPVTYFGGATDVPVTDATSTVSASDSAATDSTATDSASVTVITETPSASSSSSSAQATSSGMTTTTKAYPAANQAQATGSNIFGASAASSSAAASGSSTSSGSLRSAVVGCAAGSVAVLTGLLAAL